MSAKIAQAIWQVMQACGYVQKTGKNAFHGYKYAGEADLLEKLRPAMLEAGLLLLPSVVSTSPVDEHGNVHVIVEYTLAHKDGEVWPEKLRAAGCGNDRNKNGVGDKGTYKAITGANKYLLFKLFQIETGDDPEATEAAPEREPERPRPSSSAAYVEPYSIPLLSIEGGKEKDWRKWADDLRQAIDDSRSLNDVNDWMRKNSATMTNLAIASKSAADFLTDRADKKRGYFAQSREAA